MKLLYEGFEKVLRGVDKMVPKLATYPIVTEVSTTMIFLGPVEHIVEVEVKADKKTNGWLFNTKSIVFFIYKDEFYEVFISTLRELAQEKLAAKKLVKEGDVIVAGEMMRFNDGRIVGFITAQDLLSISQKFEHAGTPSNSGDTEKVPQP